MKSDQGSASEDPVGAFGIMVVRETARVIGVTAIPTPVNESPDDAFFVHAFWQANVQFAQQDATGVMLWVGMQRYDFDSKAQRKFTGDDAIVVTMENSHAFHGVQYMLNFRMLIKPGASS